MLVFWRKGFAASSLPDLFGAMGIKSPSLYAAFGSKEALYLEAIGHYVKTVGPTIWGHLNDSPTAREGIERLLLAAADNLPGCGTTPAGCMVTLAGIGEESTEAIQQAARKIRQHCLDMIRTRIADGVVDRELPPSTDLDALSRFFLGAYQGIAIQARDGAAAVELKGIALVATAAWPVSGQFSRQVDRES